jgi:ATP-dependent DNA helicase RecG
MTPAEQMRLREERLGIDWSAASSSRSITDVSSDAIATARDHLRRVRDDRARLADGSDREILRQLGVLTRDGRLTRAGEVLFCHPVERHSARVIYLFRDTPGGEPRATERIVLPTLLAYGRVLELVAARRSETPIALPNGQQLTIEDFPRPAIEEALANAVIHRDYHVDEPVVIDHSPQVLVVKSPGPLVSGVTPDNILTHHSKPRHPLLARTARALRLAEEVGQGIDRMYREMIASGKQGPGDRLNDRSDGHLRRRRP